ncbi:IS21 family transposase [Nonomuraea sp. NPDC049480]|uniref:IS21 family transposase n=1 Tax=Nonomuraea sp. NPDC049480 TaxID=3364353 RepID=UPI00379EE484
MEAQALRKRGWSISAIARHLGRSRPTIRAYLNGQRVPGQRRRGVPDPFEPFAEYCRLRLDAETGDPHLWATTLFDELVELGYAGGYSTFTRALRGRGLRPDCDKCAHAGGPDEYVRIEHAPGAETQWDWLELPQAPASWEWGSGAHLLVGTLPYSGIWRGVLAESEDQPHLIEALHQVCERLGGVSAEWRFDRMATVCHPATGEVTASFAQVAKHYGVIVRVCPPGRSWRKGSVEKANHVAAQRWWRTLGDDASPAQAQASLDEWCRRRGDIRIRKIGGGRVSVAELARREPLRPMPHPAFPAVLEVERLVAPQALVSFRGNFYSVPPGHAGQMMLVRHLLGAATLDIVTAGGAVLARHRRQVDHAGVICQADEHAAALEAKVLAARAQAAGGGPCPRKTRRPPSVAARAEADRLRGAGAEDKAPVVDFAAYAAQARPLSAASPAGRTGTSTGGDVAGPGPA